MMKKLIGFLMAVIMAGASYLGVDEMISPEDKKSPVVESVPEGELKVTFLDIGQGDATIIQTENNCMVIDAGENDRGKEVVAYLESQGIDRIDYFILTHPDADHIGGADDVLQQFDVSNVIMPDVVKDTVSCQRMLEEMKRSEASVITPQIGESYTLGDAAFTVLCPDETLVNAEEVNNASVGIKLIHGENSFVFCGDAEAEAEQKMVETFGEHLECDVLKCSHHGSAKATTEEFLEMTDPVWAVISCGKDNPYGHPHRELLARLEDNDTQILRTDEIGNIILASDGKDISFY